MEMDWGLWIPQIVQKRKFNTFTNLLITIFPEASGLITANVLFHKTPTIRDLLF